MTIFHQNLSCTFENSSKMHSDKKQCHDLIDLELKCQGHRKNQSLKMGRDLHTKW